MRKIFRLILFFIFSISLLFISYIIYIKYIKKAPIFINYELQKQIGATNNKKTVLILFSPDCGPCHLFINSIYDNRNRLKPYNVYFGSTRGIVETNDFYNNISPSWQHDMATFKTIYNSRKNIGTYFVKTGLPKIYIFNRKKELFYKQDYAMLIDSLLSQLEKYD